MTVMRVGVRRVAVTVPVCVFVCVRERVRYAYTHCQCASLLITNHTDRQCGS